MDEQTAELDTFPTPDTQEPLRAMQLKILTMEMILSGKKVGEWKGISELLEKSTQEHWSTSPDNRLRLLYYDLHLANYESEIKKIRRGFLERPITTEAKERIEEIGRNAAELERGRGALQPLLDEELRSGNVLKLLAKEFADPKTPLVARNIEEDPVPNFYWVIDSYAGETRMLAWIRQHGINRSLVDFFQDRHDARLFDHLKNFTTKDARREDQIGIESEALVLMKIILDHRYDHFPLEVVRKFKGLLDNPGIHDEFAQILQLTPDQHRRVQHDRFKQGELDTLPNIQENLRPLLLVDLYARLLEGADDALSVFQQWYDCWNPALWNEERTVKFIDLLLDAGYSNVRGLPEVNAEDRDKIIGRLRYLLSPKPDEEREVERNNRGLATKSTDEIQISPQTLFHETDFSHLQRILASGVYANEISSQSRNAAAGRESDLSASFWRLEDIRGDQGQISLKKAIETFYPTGTGIVAGTAAHLKNRVVLCSLDPKRPEEQDYYLYPPYSDSMHQDDPSAPMAKKFIAGTDLWRTPIEFTDVHEDVVFVLLGIPAVRFNFVIIPPELKDQYINLTKALPFYLPAYSAESGERLF